MSLGSADYREGALARIEDARRLRDQGRWVGAIYLAGRAVESFLRSLLWLNGRQQEVGHNLRDLLTKARSLGLVSAQDDDLKAEINEVASLWKNNLRFIGDLRFQRDLRDIGRAQRVNNRPVKGDPIKANALVILESCERIISRGEVLWSKQQSKKK